MAMNRVTIVIESYGESDEELQKIVSSTLKIHADALFSGPVKPFGALKLDAEDAIFSWKVERGLPDKTGDKIQFDIDGVSHD